MKRGYAHLLLYSSSSTSYSHFYMGSMHDGIRINVSRSITYTSRLSLLFDIIHHFVQPSFIGSSSLSSPLYFHFHRRLTYVVFLSYHHMPITFNTSFPAFPLRFPPPPVSLSHLYFHFSSCSIALQVVYDASHFLEKNRDRLGTNLVNLLQNSDNDFIKDLFLAVPDETGVISR